MRVDLPLDKKTVENQDWATGPLACGPQGRRGPWGAGRWAADLLLAKPLCTWTGARHTTSIRPMQWHFSQFSLFLVYF